MANASATARSGYVSASLNGGANLYGASAGASSVATNVESYLFTGGTGVGTVSYSVALTGMSTGNPAGPATVRFNGASYSVLPNATPTYYSFTESFIYGQPFLLTLSVEVRANWEGSLGDGGSRLAIAELKGLQVENLVAPSAAVTEAPEPSTAVMWIGGVVLILAGKQVRRQER